MTAHHLGLQRKRRTVDAVPTPWPAPHEVHIWRADLRLGQSVDGIRQCLCPDERHRAGRFHYPAHRRRFETGRGILRHILASYLEEDPGRIRFRYGRFGKPEVALACDSPSRLHFNVTHAADQFICAVGRVSLGVDLEEIAQFPEADAIARVFCSSQEYQSLRSLLPHDRPLAFTRCWTRKEAFIKAVGDGLAYPLNRFTVSLGPTEPPSLLSIDGQEAERMRWAIAELRTEAGYVASLALPIQDPAVIHFRFPDDFAGALKRSWCRDEPDSQRG